MKTVKTVVAVGIGIAIIVVSCMAHLQVPM